MNLTIVKCSNAFSRPKYVPRKIHNQWGVHDSDTKTTLLRNVSWAEAQRYVETAMKAESSPCPDVLLPCPIVQRMVYCMHGKSIPGVLNGLILN